MSQDFENKQEQDAVKPALIIMATAAAIMSAISVAAWRFVPSTRAIPMQWDEAGRPIWFATKAQALILCPILFFAAMNIICAIGWRVASKRRAQREYRSGWLVMWALMMFIVVIVHAITVGLAFR